MNKYIQSIREHLQEKHGEVKQEWEALLTMLDYEFDVFTSARGELKKNGLTIVTSRGLSPSPYIKIMQDSAIQVQKILIDLGCTPRVSAKVKKVDSDDDQDDFLNSLCNA